MANVKLFRVTEFAESVFQSPLAHRTALHPLLVMLLVALWLAGVGHWPLWQMLLQPVRAGAASGVLLAGLATSLTATALGLLALMAWRWTFKWGIVLLLFWTALGACAMLLQRDAGQALAVSPLGLLQFLVAPGSLQRLATLPCLLTLLIAAALPALLVARGRIRRIPVAASVATNAIVLAAVYAVLMLASGTFGHANPSVLSVLPLLGS
jgi:hypothetical protein